MALLIEEMTNHEHSCLRAGPGEARRLATAHRRGAFRTSLGLVVVLAGLGACGRAAPERRPTAPLPPSAPIAAAPAPAPAAAPAPAPDSHVYHWDTELALSDADRDTAGGAYRAVEDEYQLACARVALREQLVSPIDAFVDAVERTGRGVVVHLEAAAGPPEQVLARLHCHRAFLALAGLEHVPDSPIAVRGLVVEVRALPDGLEVTLVPRDPALVGDLERRTRTTLAGRQR